MRKDTRCVHSGTRIDPNTRGINTPIYTSSSFEYLDTPENVYPRYFNIPNQKAVVQKLCELENAEDGLLFGSGMAAITTAIMARINAASRIVASRELYGGTFEFFNDVLPKLNIETVFVNCGDTGSLLKEIEKGLDVLYLETPTNPLLRIVDIKPLVTASHKQGGVVMLDATFASPINMRPLDLGVDLVIHSATKYLGGHHDITAGFICCNGAVYDRLWAYRKILGGVMDPMTAFLAMRGLKTLELRVQRQNQSAMRIAAFLETHAKIKSVYYPGLASHPDHEIAKRQLAGFGGMLSFELDGDFEQTKVFMDRLKIIKLATSLGGVTSLANQPITNTHAALSPEDRARVGISESLVRLSVGIEPVEMLLDDLKTALENV